MGVSSLYQNWLHESVQLSEKFQHSQVVPRILQNSPVIVRVIVRVMVRVMVRVIVMVMVIVRVRGQRLLRRRGRREKSRFFLLCRSDQDLGHDGHALVHLLLGDHQRRQQPQAGAGGKNQQSVFNQLARQLLVGPAVVDGDADHQA